MSHPVNDKIKEAILDEVESMPIWAFQNALEKANLEGNSVIDSLVENLVETMFEQRSV